MIVPVRQFKKNIIQEAFDAIMLIRQKLFNEDPCFEILHMMMELGLMPYSTDTVSPKQCDIVYVYTQLSKAELKLRQMKEYGI